MTDRLTVYIEGEAREDHSRDTAKWKNGSRECMARLAAYEDTGLTPEEVTQVNDFVGSQLHKAMELNALLLKELAEVTTEKNAAIRTRERVMNKLSKQVAHTVRARHLRDEARAEADRLRAELEAAKGDLRTLSHNYQICETCKFFDGTKLSSECGKFTCSTENQYVWRGLCAENGGANEVNAKGCT